MIYIIKPVGLVAFNTHRSITATPTRGNGGAHRDNRARVMGIGGHGRAQRGGSSVAAGR